MKYTHKILSSIVISLTMLTILSSCTADGTAFNELGMPEDNQVFVLPDQVAKEVNYYPAVNPATGYPDAALLDVAALDGVAKKFIEGFFGKGTEKVVVTETKYLKSDADMAKVFKPVPTKLNEQTG